MRVSFTEWQYYDIMRDAEVVRFNATTEQGTWTAETAFQSGKDLKARRDAFKQYVAQSIQQGDEPFEFFEEDIDYLIQESALYG